MASLAERVADLSPEDRAVVLADLSEEEKAELADDWLFWAREEQKIPEGDWLAAYISGGRGSGKSRSGAEIAAQWAREYPGVDGGIVAPTFQAGALRKCIESDSGLLRALGGEGGPYVESYNRSEGVLYLRSGASIFATGAENGAVRIQGENLGWCWLDEPGLIKRTTWRTTWEESIQFAVRMKPAKIIVSGTPKAGHPLVKLLNDDPSIPKRRMRTLDNIANLDPDWVRRIMAKYEGTRLGAQELEGILIPEVEGALWLWVTIERNRMSEVPVLLRVVIGVDPSGGANEIGVVAAGLVKSPCPCGHQDEKGPHYAVLEDRSLLASPERWGAAVVGLYHDLKADRVVAEKNFGGDMVESTLRVADPSVPVKMVNASRGKAQRAEPVSALFEQNRVHHIGTFAELETEMTTWVQGDDWSPNRLDACLIGPTPVLTDAGEIPLADIRPGMRVWSRRGWSFVQASRFTGRARVRTVLLSNGSILTGTSEHRVWVSGRGWVRLDALGWGDILSGWSVSSIGASPTHVTLPQSNGPTASTLPLPEDQDGRCSTDKSTKTITDQSRLGGMFTISTRTRSKMLQRTWWRCLQRLMPSNTHRTAPRLGGWSIWSEFARWPPNGIGRRKDEPGIVSTGGEPGSSGCPTRQPVKNVVDPQLPGLERDVSVPALVAAGRRTENAVTTFGPSAQYVERSSGRRSISPSPRPVRASVVHNFENGSADVYDIQVQAREFVASGVVVHNCVWAITELSERGDMRASVSVPTGRIVEGV